MHFNKNNKQLMMIGKALIGGTTWPPQSIEGCRRRHHHHPSHHYSIPSLMKRPNEHHH